MLISRLEIEHLCLLEIILYEALSLGSHRLTGKAVETAAVGALPLEVLV